MEALKVYCNLQSQPFFKQLIHLASSSTTAIATVKQRISSSSGLVVRRCSSSTTATTNGEGPTVKVAGRSPRSSSSSSSSTSDKDGVRANRLKKVEELRSNGLEPYAYKWDRTHNANDLPELNVHLQNGEESSSDSGHVSIAGRIVTQRTFGKLAFFDTKR